VEKLRELLQARGIEIKSERLQPDGARRLVLGKSDGSVLEVTLTPDLLRGTRELAIDYIQVLLRDGVRPKRVPRE
jgi:hypothetical protein